MSAELAPAIQVRDLRKTYSVPEREGGVRAALVSLVQRKNREVAAVAGVSFDVPRGEIVGFLGPNGAGKTTTLKMLAGLLHPTSGEVSALGHVPWRRENDYLRRMTLVMGQRNQLAWDIPVVDSFELNRAIFRIPADHFRRVVAEMTELLDLGELLKKPVRNLSLGERMKCEIAGSLLHQPEVLFLDEPTIGLDVTMQRRIRGFIAAYNQRHGATTLLTSHYMADVEALCRRVVVIHQGRLLYDGELSGLVDRFSPFKTIVVDFASDPEFADGQLAGIVGVDGEIVSQTDGRLTLRVPKARTAQITGQLLAQLPIADLTVEEPPIDEVIERVFAGEAREAEAVPAA